MGRSMAADQGDISYVACLRTDAGETEGNVDPHEVCLDARTKYFPYSIAFHSYVPYLRATDDRNK